MEIIFGMKIFDLLDGKYDDIHYPKISIEDMYNISSIENLPGVSEYKVDSPRFKTLFSIDAKEIEWEEYSILVCIGWCTLWVKSKVYEKCRISMINNPHIDEQWGSTRIVLQLYLNDFDTKLFITDHKLIYGPKNFELKEKCFFLMTEDSEYDYINWKSLPLRNKEGEWYFPDGSLTKGVR